MDQLAKHDELKRKIQGYGSDSSEERDGEDVDNDGVDAVAQALGSLEQVKSSIDEAKIPETGVFSMKFMRKHAQAEIDASRKAVQDLEDELARGDCSEGEDGDKEEAKTLGSRAFNSDTTKVLFRPNNFRRIPGLSITAI
jgi:U3 small nucleolar RNA-associated protein 14